LQGETRRSRGPQQPQYCPQPWKSLPLPAPHPPPACVHTHIHTHTHRQYLEQPEADREAWAKEQGAPSALSKIITTGFKAIHLIYFFTAGADEVKCWQIRKGTKAPQVRAWGALVFGGGGGCATGGCSCCVPLCHHRTPAAHHAHTNTHTHRPQHTHAHTPQRAQQAAGTIHTDFEKGFICAEVMHYDELHELGSEHAVKAAGKYRQEGKNYLVVDGDIIYFKAGRIQK
jgi:hypothetical protein